jgi:multicomponent K+:H+ antiporter subunit E
MMRWLPAPLLSATLFVSWLLLVNGVSIGHVLLAAVLAIVIPWWSERLRPDAAAAGAWPTVARLAAIVLYDIVASPASSGCR